MHLGTVRIEATTILTTCIELVRLIQYQLNYLTAARLSLMESYAALQRKDIFFFFAWFRSSLRATRGHAEQKRRAASRGPHDPSDCRGPQSSHIQRFGKSPYGRYSHVKLGFLAAVTYYLQRSANADRKVVTGLLLFAGYSRLLEQPPSGPKASELKPITTTGKASGLNTRLLLSWGQDFHLLMFCILCAIY